MESICLLTDGCAQFASNSFRGRELIHAIVPKIKINSKVFHGNLEISASDLPASLLNIENDILHGPEFSDICAIISSLAEKYNHLIAIPASRQVNPIFDLIEKAVTTNCGIISSQIIHSQAVSAGLGYLLETAAGAALDGQSPAMIENQVRKQIPHIYTTISTPGWTYLQQSGVVDHAQAKTGEMLGVIPIFNVEEAGLAPIQKVRNEHSIFEYFQGFLEEFDELEQINFLHHDQINRQDADNLRDYVRSSFPLAKYEELLLNPTNAAIFGPRMMGLTAIEKTGA